MQSVRAAAPYQPTSRHVSFPTTSIVRFFPKRSFARTVKHASQLSLDCICPTTLLPIESANFILSIVIWSFLKNSNWSLDYICQMAHLRTTFTNLLLISA